MKDGGSAFPYEEMIVLETNKESVSKWRTV